MNTKSKEKRRPVNTGRVVYYLTKKELERYCGC